MTQSQKEQVYHLQRAKNAFEMSRYCFFSTLRDFSPNVGKVLQRGKALIEEVGAELVSARINE